MHSKKDNMPFFSIITPTYNRAEFITNAINSVINQSFTNWEYLIIDDGSTDNTQSIIQLFSDNRIRYHYQKNKERSAARNTGIKLAKGRFICFLDSDDYYLNHHLQILYTEIQKQAIQEGILYTQTYFNRTDSSRLIPYLQVYEEDKIKFILHNFLFVNSICVSSSILKQHQFQFPLHYSSWEDMYLWFKVTVYYPFAFISDKTTVVTIHNNSGDKMLSKKPMSYIFKRFEAMDMLFQELEFSFTKTQRNDYINNDGLRIASILIAECEIYKAYQLLLLCIKKYFLFSYIPRYLKVVVKIFLNNYFNKIYHLLRK